MAYGNKQPLIDESYCYVCRRTFRANARPRWLLGPVLPHKVLGKVHTSCDNIALCTVSAHRTALAARRWWWATYDLPRPVNKAEQFARSLLGTGDESLDLTPAQHHQLEYWRITSPGLDLQGVVDAYWDLMRRFEGVVEGANVA
ncbi:MAG TPA: hypothetical protein VJM51_05210 [Dehalococcoidia bacterium]|nr:hypothetical protein [Dehalococcoidia bacterium]